MEYLALLIFPLLGLVCFKAAEEKGRSRWIWGIVGTLTPVVGLLFVCFLPRIKENTAS